VPTLVVLFNLKAGASREQYEQWARTTDLPIVSRLPSVESFEVLRTSGVLGGGEAPYQYVELLRVNDLARLGQDVATETMRKVAAEFRQFADAPVFMISDSI
jgi:uncharacterized protein (TIGR02118 family)